MRIAVTAISLQKDIRNGYGLYAREVLRSMAQQHQEQEFIFLFDRPWDETFLFAANVIPVLVSPPAQHALALKYWYDVKAPLALRSYQPDVWLQPGGCCSLTTKIPQVMVIHNLAFKHDPQGMAWHQRLYDQWFTASFLRKAVKLVTSSEYTKQDIISHYGTSPEKITVAPGAAGAVFEPLSWQDRETVKDGYADGREYFLFVGGGHPRNNLITLLKAFSLFKKWQQSNMKLLVAVGPARQDAAMLGKIKTYRYRDDVVLLDYLPETPLAKVTAAAYALVYLSYDEGVCLPVVEAMQCGVPVITGNTGSIPETAGNAALYAPPDNPDAIAQQMLTLYKNETLRNSYITAGWKQAAGFSWQTAAGLCWQRLTEAAQKR